jgi:hypothetical protein
LQLISYLCGGTKYEVYRPVIKFTLSEAQLTFTRKHNRTMSGRQNMPPCR